MAVGRFRVDIDFNETVVKMHGLAHETGDERQPNLIVG